MAAHVGVCGNKVHIGQHISKPKSEKVMKKPGDFGISVGSSAGKPKPKIDWSKMDFSGFVGKKSDPTSAAALIQQQRNFAEAVANLHYVDIRKG